MVAVKGRENARVAVEMARRFSCSPLRTLVAGARGLVYAPAVAAVVGSRIRIGRSCLQRVLIGARLQVGQLKRAVLAQMPKREVVMPRIGMDDEINYRYGNGPKPPHMNRGEWGPRRSEEKPLFPANPLSGLKKVCTCPSWQLTCTCGALR